MNKFLVIGDEIISKYDGESHYVTAHETARLYGIPFDMCIFHDINFKHPNEVKRLIRQYGDIKIVRPDPTGKYLLEFCEISECNNKKLKDGDFCQFHSDNLPF